jgi:hypothetical protein
LKTEDKSNVVNSINEVCDIVIEHESAISELRDMITGQKETLVNNINDLIDEI